MKAFALAVVLSLFALPVCAQSVLLDFHDASLNKQWAQGMEQVRQGHWVRPAGSSAVDHYLSINRTLRANSSADPLLLEASNDMLQSMFAYALLATESAIERNNMPEAQRLLALLVEMDPSSPALSRLRGEIYPSSFAVQPRALAE